MMWKCISRSGCPDNMDNVSPMLRNIKKTSSRLARHWVRGSLKGLGYRQANFVPPSGSKAFEAISGPAGQGVHPDSAVLLVA